MAYELVYGSTDPLFKSGHQTTYQVFRIKQSGEAEVIALCISRKVAKLIVDALNKAKL